MSNVYQFNHAGLSSFGIEPLNLSGVTIGQRVQQARTRKTGTVVRQDDFGFAVIFDDGSESNGQTVGALSPFTRIEPTVPAVIESAERIAELIALNQAFRVKQNADQDAKRVKHATDKTAITATLRKKYPWAASNNGLTNHARAAKNMKKELSLTFPGVKFSVKSESYSGGSSINVSWDFGPTSKEVERTANKYADGHFDGMADMHEHDFSASGESVGEVLGRVKYVFCSRNDAPQSFMETIQRGICAIQQREYAGPDTEILDSGLWYKDQVSSVARELFFCTPFPVSFDGNTVTIASNGNEDGHWAKIVI